MIFGPHKEPAPSYSWELHHVFGSGHGTLRSLTWSSQPLPDQIPFSIGLTYKPETDAIDVPTPNPPAFDGSIHSPPTKGDQEDFYGFADEDWYYSAASLHGLRAVQTCTDNNREDQPTVGMMLFFENDRRESLGQWRADHVISSKFDFPCYLLTYRYRYSNYRTPSVKVVVRRSADSRENLQDDGYEDLPVSGKLVWWFSTYGNVLDHLAS